MKYLSLIILMNICFQVSFAKPLKKMSKEAILEYRLAEYKRIMEKENLNPDDFTKPQFEDGGGHYVNDFTFSIVSKKPVVFLSHLIPKGVGFVNEYGDFRDIAYETAEQRNQVIVFSGAPCEGIINLNNGKLCRCTLGDSYKYKGHEIKAGGGLFYIDGKLNGFSEVDKPGKFFMINDKDEVVEKKVTERDILDDCGQQAMDKMVIDSDKEMQEFLKKRPWIKIGR